MSFIDTKKLNDWIDKQIADCQEAVDDGQGEWGYWIDALNAVKKQIRRAIKEQTPNAPHACVHCNKPTKNEGALCNFCYRLLIGPLPRKEPSP